MEQTARKWARAWEARTRLRMIQHDEHVTHHGGAPGALGAWEHEYNHLRPHLARKGKIPAERLCELRISIPQPVRRTA